MLLKTINESYRALSALSTLIAHMKKYMQIVATPVSGKAAFRGNASIGVTANGGNATDRVRIHGNLFI